MQIWLITSWLRQQGQRLEREQQREPLQLAWLQPQERRPEQRERQQGRLRPAWFQPQEQRREREQLRRAWLRQPVPVQQQPGRAQQQVPELARGLPSCHRRRRRGWRAARQRGAIFSFVFSLTCQSVQIKLNWQAGPVTGQRPIQ